MADPIRLVPTAPAASGPELPHNVEAEAALLGALMIDNRIAEDFQTRLTAEHFFEPVHGRIYDAILRTLDRNMVANPVTLRPLFEADETLKELGGPAYLAQLTGNSAALIGARDFANQIYDLALLRELVTVGRGMVDRALDTSQEVNPIGQIESAEVALYKVAEQGGEEGGVKTFLQAARASVGMAEKAHNTGGGLSGVTSGLEGVNARTGGLHKSDLMILAGRPGMGKSSLASNIAFAAARRWVRDMEDGIEPAKSAGAKVAFFSLEMSADQIATRILAEQSEISAEQIRTGKLGRKDFERFARAAGNLETLPLYIDDTPGLSIAALRTRARRLKRRHGIGLVVIDYLQLMTGTSRGSNENRVQEISEISRGLKTLAKELDVPVLALSQLSRAVEQREDKRPQLSDLRESGSIEQDADIVFFIYRPEYYVQQREPQRPSQDSSVDVHAKHEAWAKEAEEVFGIAELNVAKQRHGATGRVLLRFEPHFTRFTDLADEARYPDRGD